MMSCGVALLLWVSLLFPLNSLAADVCFEEAVAGKMLVVLEQARILEKQIAELEGGSVELQTQINLLKETAKSMQDLIEVYKAKELMQAQLGDVKDKLHEKEIAAMKPSAWDNFTKYMTGAAGGAILAALAILLL